MSAITLCGRILCVFAALAGMVGLLALFCWGGAFALMWLTGSFAMGQLGLCLGGLLFLSIVVVVAFR